MGIQICRPTTRPQKPWPVLSCCRNTNEHEKNSYHRKTHGNSLIKTEVREIQRCSARESKHQFKAKYDVIQCLIRYSQIRPIARQFRIIFAFTPTKITLRRRKFSDNTLPCLRLPASRNRASTLVLSARATKLNRIPASLSSLPLLNDQTAQRDVPHQA